MFTKFFDTSLVDTFAEWVGVEMAKTCSPQQLQSMSKADTRRRAQFDDRVRWQVMQVLTPARLNIYQKAKLGSKLQDVLEAAGYPLELRRQLSFDIVRLVAVADTGRL